MFWPTSRIECHRWRCPVKEMFGQRGSSWWLPASRPMSRTPGNACRRSGVRPARGGWKPWSFGKRRESWCFFEEMCFVMKLFWKQVFNRNHKWHFSHPFLGWVDKNMKKWSAKTEGHWSCKVRRQCQKWWDGMIKREMLSVFGCSKPSISPGQSTLVHSRFQCQKNAWLFLIHMVSLIHRYCTITYLFTVSRKPRNWSIRWCNNFRQAMVEAGADVLNLETDEGVDQYTAGTPQPSGEKRHVKTEFVMGWNSPNLFLSMFCSWWFWGKLHFDSFLVLFHFVWKMWGFAVDFYGGVQMASRRHRGSKVSFLKQIKDLADERRKCRTLP